MKSIRLFIGALLIMAIGALAPAAAEQNGWQTGKEAAANPVVDAAYDAFDRGRYIEARKLAEQQALDGVAASNTLLGILYERGLGVPEDISEAAVWYSKGAKLGDQHAQFALGLMLAEGRGIAQNKEQAAQLFEMSAEQGNVNALYNLALIYVEGEALPEDLPKAAQLLEQAAKQDHAPSQYDLAAMYKEGAGVEKSLRNYAFWLQKAAEAGLSNAELELGIALYLGQGVKKNEKLGFQFFRRSAEKGNPVAQNRLAHAYAGGIGTKFDPVEAAKWHLLSRQSGVSDFRLDQLLATLDKEERDKAQQSASLWQQSTAALLQ